MLDRNYVCRTEKGKGKELFDNLRELAHDPERQSALGLTRVWTSTLPRITDTYLSRGGALAMLSYSQHLDLEDVGVRIVAYGQEAHDDTLRALESNVFFQRLEVKRNGE
ncbi:hypothetical protein D6817_01365 [Candidatus Pacearchaeota archaeon]|nr:MAG: hypothetical protein D6817_01365 [Candidatus Pacearchaeota archaeon]